MKSDGSGKFIAFGVGSDEHLEVVSLAFNIDELHAETVVFICDFVAFSGQGLITDGLRHADTSIHNRDGEAAILQLKLQLDFTTIAAFADGFHGVAHKVLNHEIATTTPFLKLLV